MQLGAFRTLIVTGRVSPTSHCYQHKHAAIVIFCYLLALDNFIAESSIFYVHGTRLKEIDIHMGGRCGLVVCVCMCRYASSAQAPLCLWLYLAPWALWLYLVICIQVSSRSVSCRPCWHMWVCEHEVFSRVWPSMDLIHVVWSGRKCLLSLKLRNASQMAPKCFPDGTQMFPKWLPKMLFGVSCWGYLWSQE